MGRIPRGVVNQRLAETKFSLSRHAPAPALRQFVDYYWILRWDLRGQPPHEQRVLPNLAVTVSLFRKAAGVFGPAHVPFRYVVEDQDQGLGVRFRPGCFRPFLRRPVSTIVDRHIGLDEIFGTSGAGLVDSVHAARDEEMVAIADELLCANVPVAGAATRRAADAMEIIAADPAIIRVDQLSARTGATPRSLQRLFAEHVGTGPKWAIRVYRINEAAQRIASAAELDYARLAAELGYTDQSHFTRDFTAIAGISPAGYHRLGAEER
jgi:AraC-like DNA-binding protein